MKRVAKHRYAHQGGAVLYDAVGGNPVKSLPAGSWLGVVSEDGDWASVITAQDDGWVKLEDTVTSQPFSLKASISKGMSGLIQNYILM